MAPQPGTDGSSSEYITISDTDSVGVAASEGIKSLVPSPVHENNRDSDNIHSTSTDSSMKSPFNSRIAPEELKDLLEELIRPFRDSMAAESSALPTLVSAPAPDTPDAVDAPVVTAETSTAETVSLPGLAMSVPLPMIVYPTIEAPDANVVEPKSINASLADDHQAASSSTDLADPALTDPPTVVSSGASAAVSTIACSLDTSTPTLVSTIPSTSSPEYTRKNTLPIPPKPSPPAIRAQEKPAKLPGMPPPPIVSQCHRLVFGQPTVPRGSAVPPWSTSTPFSTPFGQGNLSSSAVSSLSRSSCPPSAAASPWDHQQGLIGPAVNSSTIPSLVTRQSQGSFSTFANPMPIRKEESNGALGTVGYSSRSDSIVPPRSLGLPKFLGDVDTTTIEANDAVFYFGVICVQEHLTPSFEFLRYFGDTWVVRLKFAGHEISKMQSYPTKAAATADACRGGLTILKEAMPLWAVPDLPEPGILSNRLRWNSLLTSYCQQNGLQDPIYTQYSNSDGYRYEVEAAGLSFFGIEKFYPSIDEAVIGCAHKALHYLLVASGENGELMYRAGGSGVLAKTIVAAPNNLSKPEPKKSDQSKFPFVSSGNTAAPSKRSRKRGKGGKGQLLAEVTNSSKKPKGCETKNSQPPTAASATSTDPAKTRAVAGTEGNKTPAPAAAPAFFNPSLGVQQSSTSFGVPDAAEFAQAIFFHCRTSGNRSKDTKNPCITASEFRQKLRSYGNDLLRVKILGICDRLSIQAPDFPTRVFNVKGSPMYFEVDAYFYRDAGLRRFRGIGFAKNQNKSEAELSCHRNTVAFLMEVIMGVNKLQGSNWIEEAAMQDKTGFYL
ncbi:hypothetical protein MferCBS49748_006349 [Microsporum ferrugineum]